MHLGGAPGAVRIGQRRPDLRFAAADGTELRRHIEQDHRLRPDLIAAYSYAHLPEQVRAQRMIRPQDMPPPERKLELLELTIRRLTEAGYVYIGMDHFALPDDELSLARANGTRQRNFQGYSTHADCDLIGLGVSAIGKVGDSYSQSVKLLSQYYARLDRGMLPVQRGYHLNLDDLLRREVINELMCHGRIDFSTFEAAHGIRFNDYFAEALEQLAEQVDDRLPPRLQPAGSARAIAQ